MQEFRITHHLEEVAGERWSSRSGQWLSLFDDGSAAGTGDLEVVWCSVLFRLGTASPKRALRLARIGRSPPGMYCRLHRPAVLH